MRRNCSDLFPLVSILLLFSILSYGQSWSGILSTTRAIDWGHAGLQATFPDGETTPNPWTPPTRPACTTAQAGITVPVPSGTSLTSIATALTNCASANHTGSYLLLGNGSFALASAFLRFNGMNYVTLRGSGPMSTTIKVTGTSHIEFGASSSIGSAPLTSDPSNYNIGATSIKVTTATPPSVNTLAWIAQCDTGFSGAPCKGSPSDNGGLFVCGLYSACDLSGGSPTTNQNQQQELIITSVTNSGGGTYTIGLASGLFMPNWAFSQNATLYWETSNVAIGDGLEDLTLTMDNSQDQQVSFNNAIDSWIKGVRFVGGGVNRTIGTGGKNNLIVNNYLYVQTPSALGPNINNIINMGFDSDFMVLNNILTGGTAVEGAFSPQADVIAYNYGRDVQTTYYQATEFMHQGGSSFMLFEGNQWDVSEDDDTWGTHNLNTWFRNYLSCWDAPYVTLNARALQIDNFARFENVAGNTLGGPQCTAGYQGTSASLGYIYVIPSSDNVALDSMMRWGNCDTFTGTCRFQSSEVPTSLSGNATPFENFVPSSQNLPASFFMNDAVAQPDGGTGLSWWKVCTNWTTFPTACATSRTPPFPTSGPDVSSGPYVNGHSYDIPAAVAFNNLPIDTSYQNSYSITGSNWSKGTETLTVSGLPNVLHLMGPFQVSGGACGTGSGEAYMTGSTSTTISYALASNPGSCSSGTFKFPDVRQFDERVYQSDPNGEPPPQAPTGLQAAVQ